MKDAEPRLAHGINRRAVLRSGLLLGAVSAGLEIAVPAFTGVAEAATPTVYINGTPFPTQNNWFYCGYCYGLFHSTGGGPAGVCPGDSWSTHTNASSSNYLLGYNIVFVPNGVQEGWSWCAYCQMLYWGNAQSVSACPAYYVGKNPSTNHATQQGSYIYDMIIPPITFTSPPVQPLQSGWKYCGRCRSLFFGHGGTTGGVCEGSINDSYDGHVALQGSTTTYAMMTSG
jgi:hypothetical protein